MAGGAGGRRLSRSVRRADGSAERNYAVKRANIANFRAVCHVGLVRLCAGFHGRIGPTFREWAQPIAHMARTLPVNGRCPVCPKHCADSRSTRPIARRVAAKPRRRSSLREPGRAWAFRRQLRWRRAPYAQKGAGLSADPFAPLLGDGPLVRMAAATRTSGPARYRRPARPRASPKGSRGGSACSVTAPVALAVLSGEGQTRSRTRQRRPAPRECPTRGSRQPRFAVRSPSSCLHLPTTPLLRALRLSSSSRLAGDPDAPALAANDRWSVPRFGFAFVLYPVA